MPIDDATCIEVFGPDGPAWWRENQRLRALEREIMAGAKADMDETERTLRQEIKHGTALLREHERQIEEGIHMTCLGGDATQISQHLIRLNNKLREHLASKE